MPERIYATYLVQAGQPIDKAAIAIAGEQSTGTFVRLPTETPELVARHGARVEDIQPDEPSPPFSSPSGEQAARVRISWPAENIGESLPILLSTILGNATSFPQLSRLHLTDLELPQDMLRRFPRPQFGVAGTRRMAGVPEGPLIGTIVKPNVGLTPDQTADLVRELAAAGIDFIKDDELLADAPYSPVASRVAAVMKVINDMAEQTGKKVMYAFNVSGDVDEMRRHHDVIVAAGGTCVMVNLNWVGFAGVTALRRHSQLPIHGHRSGFGVFNRGRRFGLDVEPYQLLWRLAGADHLHVGAATRKFGDPGDVVINSALDCLTPLLGDTDVDDRAMPVFSGGLTVRDAAPTQEAMGGRTDLIYTCGGAIFAHPDGVAAGCKSIRQSWEAAQSGIPVDTHAASHPELAAAAAHWRNR